MFCVESLFPWWTFHSNKQLYEGIVVSLQLIVTYKEHTFIFYDILYLLTRL